MMGPDQATINSAVCSESQDTSEATFNETLIFFCHKADSAGNQTLELIVRVADLQDIMNVCVASLHLLS